MQNIPFVEPFKSSTSSTSFLVGIGMLPVLKVERRFQEVIKRVLDFRLRRNEILRIAAITYDMILSAQRRTLQPILFATNDVRLREANCAFRRVRTSNQNVQLAKHRQQLTPRIILRDEILRHPIYVYVVKQVCKRLWNRVKCLKLIYHLLRKGSDRGA